MKAGGAEGVETDQYRVSKFIIEPAGAWGEAPTVNGSSVCGHRQELLADKRFHMGRFEGVNAKACAPTGIQALLPP